MNEVKLHRVIVNCCSIVSFFLLVLIDSLKKGFSGKTLILSAIGSLVVFLIIKNLKMFEFDSDQITVFIGIKRHLKQRPISLNSIQEITWKDSKSIRLVMMHNEAVEEFAVMADAEQLRKLIGFVQAKNSQVVIEESKSGMA